MTSRPRLFIPDRILPAVLARAGETFALLESVDEGPDGILATINVPVDDALLAAAGPGLRIVANYAVGVDNIDLEAAAARDIVVTNTPDVLTQATAEFAVGLMLSLVRRIAEGDRLLRARTEWHFSLDFMLAEGLDGKAVGIVGAGRIGRATAAMASAFGARPVLIGRNDPLHRLLGELDIVSLHCPLTPETRHLINADALALMKPQAFLVNTARGPLVDEAALADALARGALRGAALDVFEYEPRVTERLLEMDNVVVTPHMGSGTRATREAMGFMALRSLEQLLVHGEEPANQVAVART